MNEINEINENNENNEVNGKDQTISKKYVQTFNNLVPTYGLNKESNSLVQTGTRDVSKEVNAHYTCSLDFILDKFLNFEQDKYNFVDTDEIIEVYHDNDLNGLNALSETFNNLDYIREKYNIPENISNYEVSTYLEKIGSDLKKQISILKESEVKDDEKED